MYSRTACRYIVTTVLVVAILLIGSPLYAQQLVRANTPGVKFSPEGAKGKFEDIPGGRRFRFAPDPGATTFSRPGIGF